MNANYTNSNLARHLSWQVGPSLVLPLGLFAPGVDMKLDFTYVTFELAVVPYASVTMFVKINISTLANEYIQWI